MEKTKTVVTAGVDVQKDGVECSVYSHPGEASCGLIASSFVAGPDVIESTLSEVLVARLATGPIAHLVSEATTCAEAVKAAYDVLRANPTPSE